MVFSLPHFSSGVFSFIDTSPPVVYPSKPKPLHRARSKTTTAISTPPSYEPSLAPPPFPRLRHQSSRHSLTTRQPQEGQGKATKTLAASMSALDLGAMWQPLPGGGLEERRRSISQMDGGKPMRPGHRRCQSALSAPQSPPLPTLSTISLSPSTDFGPRPLLQEYSRNSLSSSSATSLPTLAEMGQDMDAEDVGVSASGPVTSGGRVSIPPSPIVRPSARLSRGSSVISLSSPPSSSLLHTPGEDSRHRSLVPPPQPAPLEARKYASMPPPPLHPSPASITYSPSKTFHRPRPSRTQSFRDADSVSGLKRPSHSRRASVDSLASAEVSDVAVMATWSFPASPSPEKKTPTKLDVEEDPDRGRRLGSSNRLRERLKSLSELDTSWRPPNNSASSLSGRTSTSSMDSTDTVIRPSRPLPSHLSSRHRHTHSSPNVLFQTAAPGAGSPGAMGLPLQPLLPPPRPQRRTTTTRLRNPNPLSMHSQSTASLHRASSVGAGKGELSSSPGSMVSDTTTCPSPTSSIRSLPAGSMMSIPAIHLNGETAVAEAESRWWGALGSFRRSLSKSDLLSTDEVIVSKSVSVGETENGTEEFGLDLDDNEEEYIDMDHM
ncbi:hypothetical protein B9479_000939 [Cryptococcus floricola]|uniref:Uncharacterized protein n=1 Tax=Cryptococcus floricola TaxID=2591691 RepID=A0A5D3B880_9TREE|nr:hypothetical protein B9479_000939 [Cryptococcus floricola]